LRPFQTFQVIAGSNNGTGFALYSGHPMSTALQQHTSSTGTPSELSDVEAVVDTIGSFTDYLKKMVADANIDAFNIREDLANDETREMWRQRSKTPASQLAYETSRQSHIENVFGMLLEIFLEAIEHERRDRSIQYKWFGLTVRRNTILYSICVDTSARESEVEKIEDVDVFYRAEYLVAALYNRRGVELVTHIQDSRWSCERPNDLIVLVENNKVMIADNSTAS
jgi:hypothetical protein